MGRHRKKEAVGKVQVVAASAGARVADIVFNVRALLIVSPTLSVKRAKLVRAYPRSRPNGDPSRVLQYNHQ